jgi:putative flippase GtrA
VAVAGGPRDLLQQMARYGLVGVANTAVGLGTILALQNLAGIDPFAANPIGYAVGLATSFLLNRIWTFRARDRAAERLVRFLLAFGVAYGANLLTLALLIEPAGASAAQICATVVYSVLFFVLCRAAVYA